jgi:hypothetical protein
MKDLGEKPSLDDLARDDQQTFPLIVSAVTGEVIRVLDQRKVQKRGIYLTGLSISAAIVISLSGFLINELLTLRVNNRVQEALDGTFLSWRFESTIAALNLEGQRISQADGFTDDEARSFINKVRSVYLTTVVDEKLSRDLREANAGKLLTSVGQHALAFASARRTDLVAELEAAVPLVAEKSMDFTQTMVQVLGRSALAQPGAPTSWTDGTKQEINDFERFRMYAQRAKNRRYPELFLAYELVVRDLEGRRPEEIKNMIDDIAALNEVDLGNFQQIMITNATTGFTTNPNPGDLRVGAAFRSFLKKYRSHSPIIEDLAIASNAQ